MITAARVYAEASWRRLRRGRFLLGSLTIICLPSLISCIAAAHGRWGAGLFHESLEMYLRLLLPLGPILLASQAVAEEVELNTHTYLFARPAPRAAIVLGKSFTAAAALLPAYLIGVLLTFGCSVLLPLLLKAEMHGSDVSGALRQLPQALIAIGMGTVIFTGVAAGIGTLFVRRPLLGGFLYILVIEELFGNLPGALKVLSVSFYLRAVAGLLGEGGGLFKVWEPRPEPIVAAAIALGMGGLWLLLATWLVSDAEYRESSR